MPLTLLLGHRTLKILLENTLSQFTQSTQKQIILFAVVQNNFPRRCHYPEVLLHLTAPPPPNNNSDNNNHNDSHFMSMSLYWALCWVLALDCLYSTPSLESRYYYYCYYYCYRYSISPKRNLTLNGLSNFLTTQWLGVELGFRDNSM